MGEGTFQNTRINGINGLDIAAIMGLIKNRTIHNIYLEKTEFNNQNINYEDLEGLTEEGYWSLRFKEVVAQEYSVRTNKKVRKDNKVLFDKEYDFMLGNIDRKIIGENSILMCKVENIFLPSEWNGGNLPGSYILEAQHNMRVYKADKCIIASLIGGKKFICREIERDDKVIDMIIKIEKDFWINNVLNKVPPKKEKP